MNKEVEAVRQSSSNKLLQKKGVTGTGVGKKFVNGLPTDDDAILVFVQKKRSNNTIRTQGIDNDIVPDEIDGIPTDVVEVGEIQLQKGFRTKERPIKPGFSISHENVTAGTIGGLFYDRDGDVVALSNFHVLADDGKAKPGDIIYQPGTADSRETIKFKGWTDPIQKHPYIGTLKRFHPLQSGVTAVQDSAIAKIHPDLVSGGYIDLVYPELNNSLAGFGTINIGESAYKCGRTTGFTNGRVIAKNAEFQIPYGFGTVKFTNLILTNAMSQGGDSVGGETELYYRVNDQLRFGTIENMYEELTVNKWITHEKYEPKELVEVLSCDSTRAFKKNVKGELTESSSIKWYKVNWLYSHLTDKRLFKIWTRDHREIVITEDHGLFGGTNLKAGRHEFPEIRGSEINIGDNVLVPSSYGSVGNGEHLELDDEFCVIVGLFLGDGSFEREGRRFSISCGGNKAVEEFLYNYISSKDEYSSVSQLAVSRYVDNENFDRHLLAHETDERINTIHKAISSYKNRGYDTPRKITYMNKKGDVLISNIRISKKLLNQGLHNGFATKSIPNHFMTGSLDNCRSLLKGLFSSDGGLKFKKSTNNFTIAFGVSNKKLASQVRILLWRCGISCSMSNESGDNSGFKKTASPYRVVIASKNDLQKFLDEIGLIGHEKRVIRAEEQLQRMNGLNHYELTSKTVRGIEEQFIKRKVYDLSVEGEKFIANGFVCHNSGSLGINKKMEAFGLLFAGSPKVTLFNEIGPIVQYYGLRPMNEPEENNESWQKYNWRKATTDGQIIFEDEYVTFRDNAHHHCYIETSAKGKTNFSAYLNKGTDQGTSWGIGLTLIFATTKLKINLRFRSGYGVYVNDRKDLSIGKVKPRTKYTVGFFKEGDTWVGTVQPENGRIMRVLELPASTVGGDPQMVRIGKTGDNHGPKDWSRAKQKSGAVGNCHMLDFNMS